MKRTTILKQLILLSILCIGLYANAQDIYVGGRETNNGIYTAKIWKNGTPQSLTDGSQNASVKSVFVSGGDVYVAGYESNEAKLWENGLPQALTDGSNFSHAYSVFVDDGQLGVENFVGPQSTISFYPNPVGNTLYLDIQEPARLLLYNTLGQLVKTIAAHQGTEVDMKDLPAGIYFLKGPKGESAKIVKQ